MNLIDKMKLDWDRRAKHHPRFWIATEDYETEAEFARSGEHTASTLLARISEWYQSHWRVLEIGCGIGRILKPLSPSFRHLTGIDVSKEMIEASKAWLRGIPNVETLETSGVDLAPLPSSHFDLVYSYVAFQHMPRPVFDRYVQESNRVLALHGFLVFQLPVGPPRDAPLEDTIAVRRYSFAEMQEKLAQNGFDLVDIPQSGSTLNGSMTDHDFWVAKKSRVVKPEIHVGWVQPDCDDIPSMVETILYLTFAERCLQRGRRNLAIETFHTLLAHNPSSLEGWLKLVTTLLETGEIEQAIAALRQFSAAHPTYTPARVTLTHLLQKQEETCSSVRSEVLTR